MADAIVLPNTIDFSDILSDEFWDRMEAQVAAEVAAADAQTKIGYGNASAARGQAGLSPAGLFGDVLAGTARAALGELRLRWAEKQLDLALQVFLQKMRDASALAQIAAQIQGQKEVIELRAEKNEAQYDEYITSLVNVATGQYSADITFFKNVVTTIETAIETEDDEAIIAAKAAFVNGVARAFAPPIIPPQPPYV